MSEISDLQKKLASFRDERDWKQFHNPKDISISIVLEAGELLECFQWRNNQEIEDTIRNKKEHIKEEIADVFNWLLLLSHDLGIDLIKASNNKIEQNRLKYPVEKAKGNAKKYNELR